MAHEAPDDPAMPEQPVSVAVPARTSEAMTPESRIRRVWATLDTRPGVTQIMRRERCGKTTAWRVLVELERRGIIQRDPGCRAYRVVEPFVWVETDGRGDADEMVMGDN